MDNMRLNRYIYHSKEGKEIIVYARNFEEAEILAKAQAIKNNFDYTRIWLYTTMSDFGPFNDIEEKCISKKTNHERTATK